MNEIMYFSEASSKEDRAKLFQKMAKVIEQCPSVPKNGYNSFQNYNYVEENDVVKTVRPILIKNGLVPLPPTVKNYAVNGNSAVATVTMGLADTETGEMIYADIVVEGFDKGDKKFPKSYASATKYFYLKMLLIGTGEDPEQDTATDYTVSGGQTYKQDTKESLIHQNNDRLNVLAAAGYTMDYISNVVFQEIGPFNSMEELDVPKLEIIASTLDNLKNRI